MSARVFPRPTDVMVWLPGLSDLWAAYGADIRTVVISVVLARLEACGLAPQAFDHPDGLIFARVEGESWQRFPSIKDESGFTQWVQAEISRDPIVHGGQILYVHAEVVFSHDGESFSDVELEKASEHGFGGQWPVQRSSLLANRRRNYLADMNLAGQLLDDLGAERLCLAFQPIVALAESGQNACLYREALLRRSEKAPSATYALPQAIAAMERLGLVRRLDRSVVWTVVRALERHPDQRLGCNVSAMSLRDDAWWRVLLSYLRSRHDIASRLTLEITETSEVNQSEDVFALVAAVQVCGTRIALDDIGVGNTTWDFLARARPDVAKIDRSILTRSRSLGYSPDVLRNLVRVCADYSPCVVVEGIETDMEMSGARYAGAQAVQGYLIARPSLYPDWLGPEPLCVADAYAPAWDPRHAIPLPSFLALMRPSEQFPAGYRQSFNQ